LLHALHRARSQGRGGLWVIKKYFGARGFQRGVSDQEKEFILAQIWEDLTEAQKTALDETRRREVPDRNVFDSMPYAERIDKCERPENIPGPSPKAWEDINSHLGTNASNLFELINELGSRLFGHRPRVGDAFCGGGSIPFEAARIGCDALGSDLNPVAGLLTWAGLNLLGGGREVQEHIISMQAKVLEAANQQVKEWGIESNEYGERADAYLYCVEVKPEGCDYFIPLAPSWLIGEKSKVVARWHRAEGSDRLIPEIAYIDDQELKLYKAKKGATVMNGRIVDPFDTSRTWSLESLRGPQGLRNWNKEDLLTRPEDVFQERLYCIRWVKRNGERRYASPSPADISREKKALDLLRERLQVWQEQGHIPSKPIPKDGDKTEEPIRTRGWTYWHHLFTPRQLLTHGLIAELSSKMTDTRESKIACLLGIGRMANWDSRLCVWDSSPANEKGALVFLNQALNPLFAFCGRPLVKWDTTWPVITPKTIVDCRAEGKVQVFDARDLNETCDIWLTDPPYADAVNYHELGDFFLSWQEKAMTQVFPEWASDSRSQLAVRGDGDDFKRSMVEIYRNLAVHMPNNGMQMVQFTHQNPAVWADLGMT